MANNWEAWDAKKRGEGVRVAKSATGGHKVTSGGKHLGNIERRGNKHIAVTKSGRSLASREFDSHEEALDHIRKVHGLRPMTSAQRHAARMS